MRKIFDVLNDACLSVFGETEVEGLVTIAGLDVRAIYDSAHYQVDGGISGGSALITSVGLLAADAATVTVGTTPIIARGIEYRATDKRPDSGGWVIVQLEKAPDGT